MGEILQGDFSRHPRRTLQAFHRKRSEEVTTLPVDTVEPIQAAVDAITAYITFSQSVIERPDLNADYVAEERLVLDQARKEALDALSPKGIERAIGLARQELGLDPPVTPTPPAA